MVENGVTLLDSGVAGLNGEETGDLGASAVAGSLSDSDDFEFENVLAKMLAVAESPEGLPWSSSAFRLLLDSAVWLVPNSLDEVLVMELGAIFICGADGVAGGLDDSEPKGLAFFWAGTSLPTVAFSTS